MKKKVFKGGILLLIILFLGLYYAYSNGYYEKKIKDKILLTNEKIEEFEQDLKDGKDITLEDYKVKETDYSTRTSKFSLNISSKAEHLVDSAIKYIFKKLGNALEWERRE